MYFIGLDMSLRSPGWVVCDYEKKIMHVFGIRQRQSDPLGMYCGKHQGFFWKFSLYHHDDFQLSSDAVHDRTRIYQRLVSSIIASLHFSMPNAYANASTNASATPRPIHILIENYAYGAIGSRASHILPELGGMVRTQLSLAFPTAQWVEKMPVTIKKSFTGSGRAKKKDMIKEYHRRGYPELPSSAHPWEDMVDGLAMALCLRDLVRPAISLYSKLR